MKKLTYTLVLFLTTINLLSSPLHSKLKHNVFIDTDGSPNDLTAISLLLSHSGISIKAFLISAEKSNTDKTILRIRSILQQYEADTIPVINGSDTQSDHIFHEIMQKTDDKFTIVCLGPLTNINRMLIKSAPSLEKIEEIIWYNESLDPLWGYNYESDKKGAENILNSGIVINVISNLDDDASIIDPFLYSDMSPYKSKLSNSLYNIYKGNQSGAPITTKEEYAALFLISPELFNISVLKEKTNLRCNTRNHLLSIKELVSDMINGLYEPGHYVAFKGFPVLRELYIYDVRQIMDSAITKHGIEEWKACVMTDEFHGHLGVYSIVGAKMGILAREFFGIGTDLMEISTFAGSTPPFSCMNDGLQVSTGATLGQGTIHLAQDPVFRPQAKFTYQNRSILIKLRVEYLSDLKNVIEEGVKNYGLEDEGYWTYVRQTALKYWLEWDRNIIFEITEL